MWSDVVEAETIRVPVVPGMVAVIGLGRIGLPMAVQYAARGWRVVACDANERVVESIKDELRSLYEEPALKNELSGLIERGLLSATTNTAEAVARANVVIVVGLLQFDEKHQVRFQELDALTETIGRALQPGTLVSYEMPLPVGTTAGRLRACLEDCSGLDASKGFYLAYSPERASLGHTLRDLRAYPKIVGGVDARSTQAAAAFYRSALSIEVMTVASTAEAEFVKLLEITYRDVNIALANEFACYADEHGLDVMAAIAAANSQLCAHIHQPGVGVGGPTLPVYPYLLIDDVSVGELPDEQRDSQRLRLPRAARLINDGMAEYAVQRIEAEAGSLYRRSVLLLGVTYREDVRETTLSSVYPLQAALWRHGATVYADDPLYSPAELHALGFQPLPPGRENEIDAMILQAAHSAYQSFDFRRFSRCRVLLDGRHGLQRARIQEAGMRYMALGNGVVDGVPSRVPFRGDTRP
jgi:nucleotide sugar dehydrogenase